MAVQNTEKDTDKRATSAKAAEAEAEELEEDEEGDDDEENESEIEFSTWLASQPANVKAAYEKQTAGLKSALDTERAERKALNKRLTKLSKSEGTSEELATQLKTLQAEIAEQTQRAAFYEAAGNEKEIGARVTNPKLAYIALKAADLIDKDGDVDWETAKADYPELFAAKASDQKEERKKTPKGNAGSGGSTGVTGAFNMNEWIRGNR